MRLEPGMVIRHIESGTEWTVSSDPTEGNYHMLPAIVTVAGVTLGGQVRWELGYVSSFYKDWTSHPQFELVGYDQLPADNNAVDGWW